MSMVNGETIVCGQHHGDPVELVIHGDEFYARYECRDGYTVVYDTDVGCYCYATLVRGHFASTGVHIRKPVPAGIRRHLKEGADVRDARFRRRHAELRPQERDDHVHVARTVGPAGGLLGGRRLANTGAPVRGLTILADFDDVRTNITRADVDDMLNGDNFTRNGNYCSARRYFQIVSSGKLDYSNVVVGPVQLSHRRSHYIDNLLVREALDLALVELEREGLTLADFDSRGEGVVDALNVLYAGRTQYAGDLWPHNSVRPITRQGVRTHYYLLTSLGRDPVDLSIGTFCHENGHLLCRFPDMYDYGSRDGDAEDSEGIGRFCLMGSGNHNNGGRTPSPVCGYLRELAGWVDDVVSLNQHGGYDASHGDYATVMKYETVSTNEYFIVENRTRQGLDAGLPDSGLAVYHCDIFGSNEWQGGTADRHYQCAVLQADGHLDLEHNRNRGDDGDLFPQTPGVVLSHATTPASRMWDGSDSGLIVSDIGAPGDTIPFSIGAGGEQRVQVETSPDLLIPDSNSAGVRSTLEVAGAGSIEAVAVDVHVTHSYTGDLVVTLEPPDGDPVVLREREGGESDDIVATFDTGTTPALADLAGRPLAGPWSLHVRDMASLDIGRINRWGLDIVSASTENIVDGEAHPALDIPDNDAVGIESTIGVGASGELKDILVKVRITHTYIGDLRVDLASPSGQSTPLHVFEGGRADDIDRAYDQASTPLLAGLVGQPIDGDWTLRVQDRAAMDQGRLEEWSIQIRY